MSTNNFYLISLGCDKNRVDGETMLGTLCNAGYNLVNDPSAANVIIVNTCGFIREAVQESIDLILELSEHKISGECQTLIVVGCMAERYRNEIMEAIPETDIIVGVGEYEGIADVVAKFVAPAEKPTTDKVTARLAARAHDAIPHIAYIKISEGCDNHCTYCTIPSIRGPYKSRAMEEIVDECIQLVQAGAKELVLIAQDTALYGVDIYGTQKLPELMRKIAKKSGGSWIRLMYAYPEHITQELVDAMAELPQVCKYIDMPIQHSEDYIIKKMGRKGSRKQLENLIATLREKIPDITIRTTLIVGFPGESTAHFNKLYSFVKKMEFDRLGVFPYSQEEGTPAAKMPNQVRESTKLKRMESIMDLQQQIHFDKQRNKIGKILPVMVDFKRDDGYYSGRTQWDAFDVDSLVVFSACEDIPDGEICLVKITDSDQYDLRGHHEPAE